MVSEKHDVSKDFEAQWDWEDLLGVRMATRSKQGGKFRSYDRTMIWGPIHLGIPI